MKPSSDDWRRWTSQCQAEPMTPPAEQPGDDPIERRRRWQLRHWPPDNQVPAFLTMRRILGRSESVAVVLLEVVVYKTGLNFHVIARGRPGLHPTFIASIPEIAKRMGVPEATSTPAHLEVVYEDGTSAVDMSSRDLHLRLDEVADRPVCATRLDPARPTPWTTSTGLPPSPREASPSN